MAMDGYSSWIAARQKAADAIKVAKTRGQRVTGHCEETGSFIDQRAERMRRADRSSAGLINSGFDILSSFDLNSNSMQQKTSEPEGIVDGIVTVGASTANAGIGFGIGVLRPIEKIGDAYVATKSKIESTIASGLADLFRFFWL